MPKRNAVLEEHERVIEVVARLEAWVAPKVPRDNAWPGELCRRAGAVLEQLKIHFSGDAESSVFRELATTAPHLIGKLTALGTEHAEILKNFRDIAECAAGADVRNEVRVNRLTVQSRKTIATLRRHEAEENEIILQSIWEDLGAGD